MSSIVEAMIQTLTEQLFKALMNQAEFAVDFSGQIEKLKTGLDLTEALLADTESLALNHKNNIVKAALFELREVIFKADDVLIDCLVRDEYRKDGFCSGSCLHDPFFPHRTRKKLRDINLRMKEIEKTLGQFLRAPDSIHRADVYQCRVMLSQDPTEIIGFDNDVKKIKSWIFDTSKVLHHVGIVGMGGLGKTAIAQKIFHDLEVVGHFHKLIWVCVSQSFSPERIMWSILEGREENVSAAGVTQILSRIQQLLKDKSCLIVMDDVWINYTEFDWWTKLCSVIPKQNSCIIVTTRNEEAALRMGVKSSQIHRPETLNDEESWCLFSEFAFPTTKGLCPEDRLEKLGKELLKKCGGLPLAIKTIGSLLASMSDSPSQWRRVLESFHALRTKVISVMASLRLSYDELPPGLKQCLLCFFIYPEDYDIRADQLIHWWIGEGLVQSKGSRTAVEVGYEYLAELISRCLVEIVQRRGFDGKVYKCKIHNMVRELIIMIAEKEQFCCFDERGRQELTENTRWLCFVDEMEEKYLKHSSKLRAMLLMSTRKFDFERNSGFLRSLRMLDLSKCTVDEHCVEHLFSWISSLKRLASLNLSGIQALKEVPSSINKLLNLQLLLLAGCSNLEKIHPSITNLKKLITLDIGGCPIQYLPQGLGRFSYLEELSGFKVVSQPRKPCFQLLELRELINLRVLRIHVSSTTVIANNELDVLSQLRRLNVLDIDAEDCRDINVLEMLERLTPPPTLQELYLRNYKKETLPKWVSPEQLSRLRYLCIENADFVKLSSGQTTWWNLEGMCLKYLRRLKVDWKDLEKDMPVIHYMEISNCYNLNDFPCSVMEPGVWRKN